MEKPSDLDVAVVGLLDGLGAVRRQTVELRAAYARLDSAGLAVDELGDEISPAAALTEAKDALADVDRALGLSVDAVYAAMRYTSRLREQ